MHPKDVSGRELAAEGGVVGARPRGRRSRSGRAPGGALDPAEDAAWGWEGGGFLDFSLGQVQCLQLHLRQIHSLTRTGSRKAPAAGPRAVRLWFETHTYV